MRRILPLGKTLSLLVLLTTLRAQIAPPNQDYVPFVGAFALQTSATAAFAPGSSFTMEGWFYRTDNLSFNPLMGKGLARTTSGEPFLSFGLVLDENGSGVQFATST